MIQGNRSKENLNSDAYLSRIHVFIPQRVSYEKPDRAVFSPYRFRDPYSISSEKGVYGFNG